jgi:hypothetical protein
LADAATINFDGNQRHRTSQALGCILMSRRVRRRFIGPKSQEDCCEAMLTIQDCIDMCRLTEDEIAESMLRPILHAGERVAPLPTLQQARQKAACDLY